MTCLTQYAAAHLLRAVAVYDVRLITRDSTRERSRWPERGGADQDLSTTTNLWDAAGR